MEWCDVEDEATVELGFQMQVCRPTQRVLEVPQFGEAKAAAHVSLVPESGCPFRSYVLHQRGDKNREFYLTICLYDIPSSHH